MKSLSELQNEYYNEFVGLPSTRPIVRNNQKNDAFELVVLKILYGKELPEFKKSNVSIFAKKIIAPPDGGIDIVFQREIGDEPSFDIIQVKYGDLTEDALRNCILKMKRTIADYCKDPRELKSESCREVLSETDLNGTNKDKCAYYVVHTGTVDDFQGSEENEKIITVETLDILYRNTSEHVDSDSLSITKSMEYEAPYDNSGAIICNLNGYDLAELCNTYYSTEVGRNILFGSNLRESLITKKSKPFLSMSKTITECPENFWYYNNGITIIAKDIIQQSNGKIELKCFSIVNGAQTTSALGLFLKEAKTNGDIKNIDSLKQVYVLTRILKVQDEKMRQDIAIFNNTQTPITSRDMVANRPEQKHLNEWLLDDSYPRIYVEIRRGARCPNDFSKTITHRLTNNEELAQLIYASLQQPFTAKDKKNTLFNNDYTQPDYVINETYHTIFNWDENDPSKNGVVFKKTKTEIDELLFIRQLYREMKKVMKAELSNSITKIQEEKSKAITEEQKKSCDDRREAYTRNSDTIGICLFYFIALYYEFKVILTDDETKTYDYDRYYQDKDFRKKLISRATDLFLTYTLKILVKTARESGKQSMSNWIRSANCQKSFLESLRTEMASDFKLRQEFNDFRNEFMV